MHTVSLQYEIRPELPNVYGTLDYREFRDILVKIDYEQWRWKPASAEEPHRLRC